MNMARSLSPTSGKGFISESPSLFGQTSFLAATPFMEMELKKPWDCQSLKDKEMLHG
jgi:hypothetical protein